LHKALKVAYVNDMLIMNIYSKTEDFHTFARSLIERAFFIAFGCGTCERPFYWILRDLQYDCSVILNESIEVED